MSESQIPAGANKGVVQRFWDEVVNQGKLDVADEIIAPGWVVHDTDELGSPGLQGPEAAKQLVEAIRDFFSDLRVTVENQADAEGDQVVTRFAASGTDQKGHRVEVRGVGISEVSGEKIAGSWLYWESGRMYEQLGELGGPTDPGLRRPPWGR